MAQIKIAIDLLLIAISTVIVIDISGFVEGIKNSIKKWLNVKGDITLKPFDCSLCSTFWLSIVYLIIHNTLTIPSVTLSLFIAILTPQINHLLRTIQDTLTNLINKIN